MGIFLLLVIRSGQPQKRFYYCSANAKFPRDRCSCAISPTFPTTLIKGLAECKWANTLTFLLVFSLFLSFVWPLLLLLYASFMQALSNDLKRIQLFCAREKPLLANLIIKIMRLLLFFSYWDARLDRAAKNRKRYRDFSWWNRADVSNE